MSRSRLLANRPLVAIVLGAVVIVGLILVSAYRTQQLIDHRAVVDGLVHSVAYDTVKSHLGLEEHLAGDDDPRLPGDIDQRLADALGACTTLRVGGLVAGRRVEPLAMAAQPSVGALCDRLVTLQALTGIRVAEPAAHGAGSELDQDYDTVFTEALASAERVYDAAGERAQARRAGLIRLMAALVAAVGVTFGLMVVTVSRHARQVRQSSRRQGESEAWFRTLVYSTSDLIVVLDAESAVVYANPVAEDALGFSPAEEAGRDLFDHVHPDDREAAAEEFTKWLRHPQAAHPWVFRLARADGDWRTLEAIFTNCLDDPAVAGVVVNARDVTETRKSRDALGVSESLLREAQRISHVGHWQWEVASDRAEWLAEEVYAIHGVSPAEWDGTGGSYADLIPPEDRHIFYDALEQVLVTGRATAAHRIVRPDGTVRHVRNRSEQVPGEAGAPLRVVGTCQDVTDQEELRRALDGRVKELTCLAAVRHAVQEMGDAADVCVAAVAALGPAMQHPQLAVATVNLDGRRYGKSDEPAGAGRQLNAAVVVNGTARGQVQVSYTCAAATFLPHEHDLVQSVADKLALGLERHEPKATLAESQAQFRRLVDNIPDVVFRYRLGDGEGIDYVSPSVEGLTGYNPQEFLDDPELVRQILVGSNAAMEPNSAHAPPGDDGTGGAVQLVARDGSVRWVEYNIVLVHDAVGSVVAVEGVARDVTERRAAEQALGQRAREHAALARFGEAALTIDELADLYDLAAA